MQTTLLPAFTAGTICGSISPMLLCVLMQTTSGFRARTASKSVVILTSHGRPSSSPTVLPSLAGLVTMTPQRSMSFGRSRMYPRRPWPIMPVPHSATLIMSAPLHGGLTSFSCVHTEYAAGGVTLPCRERDRHRPTRDSQGHGGGTVRLRARRRCATRPETRGERSGGESWRRLVDPVVRQEGKLFAHLRLLGRRW